MLKRLAENFLIAANIFILFLIVFIRNCIPAWLRVIVDHPLCCISDRTAHPLALVLDLLMMLRNEAMRTYASLINTLWLTGALTAAIHSHHGIVAIKERRIQRRRARMAQVVRPRDRLAGFGLILVPVLSQGRDRYRRIGHGRTGVAGHFRANLTHGNDFLLAPVTPQQKRVERADKKGRCIRSSC